MIPSLNLEWGQDKNGGGGSPEKGPEFGRGGGDFQPATTGGDDDTYLT